MTDDVIGARPQAAQPRRHRRSGEHRRRAACCAPSAWATTTAPSRRSASRRRWNEITPCNLSLDRLATGGQGGRARGRRLPAGVRHHLGVRRHLDGPRGHALLAGLPRGHRRLVETVMQAERLDGSVLLAGCDKSLPGMLMAAARLDLASVFLYAGSILPGTQARTARARRHDHRRVRGRRGVPARADHPRGRRRDRARHLPGRGRLRRHVHRQHDGLARPRRWACRCPASAAPPAVDRRRDGYARRSGEAVVELLRAGHHRAPDHDQARRSRTPSPS